jgi:hypothetical protein
MKIYDSQGRLQFVGEKGDDGADGAAGVGGMSPEVYDPRDIHSDVFYMKHMVETSPGDLSPSYILTSPERSKLGLIEAEADVTDATNVALAGAVMSSLYDANTVLLATSDNTPVAAALAANTWVGRLTGSPGVFTMTQLTAALNTFTSPLQGLVPAPVTAVGKYLKDDGTWASPPGGAGATTASGVSYSPTGDIAATDVQAAITELDSEKSGTGHSHSGTYLELAGGTMSGAINMGNGVITNLDSPSSPSEATNKGYVDLTVGALTHEGFADRSSPEHLDWSASQVENIHIDNFTAASPGHVHVKAHVTDLQTITASPTANQIPLADGSGKLDNGWLNTGSGNDLDADTVDGEEAANIVTTARVNTAGAVMNADTSVSPMAFVKDEDNLASDSNAHLATQQSIKAYVDGAATGEVNTASDPGTVGLGLVMTKVGVDLRFRNINASPGIRIIDSVDRLDLILSPAAIDHDALGGYSPKEHLDWSVSQSEDVHSDNYSAASPSHTHTYLPLAGGTMSGAIAMTTEQITGLGSPSLSDDAANMGHVTTGLATKADVSHNASTHSDISTSGASMNMVLKWNGTNWVPGIAGDTAEFTFSVASFTDNESTTQLIGSGVWEATSGLTFGATYNNGPPATAEITMSTDGGGGVWGTNPLVLTTPFAAINSASPTNYPTSKDKYITFTLDASPTDGAADSDTETVYFRNLVYWGLDTKASGYTEADIESLAGGSSAISNDQTRSVSLNATSGLYLVFAFPSSYTSLPVGTDYETDGDNGTGFRFNGVTCAVAEDSTTLSITNSAGFTENYKVYVSTVAALGSSTLTTYTSTTELNYLYYGKTTGTSGFSEADIEGLATSTITNDHTQTWSAVTTGSGEYMLFSFPKRLGIPTFWVGGFEGGFESPETVGVTNVCGWTEDYYVWRSTNANLGSTVVETQ